MNVKASYLGMSLVWCMMTGTSVAADADGAVIARTCAACHDMDSRET
jgi:cytochrome c2